MWDIPHIDIWPGRASSLCTQVELCQSHPNDATGFTNVDANPYFTVMDKQQFDHIHWYSGCSYRMSVRLTLTNSSQSDALLTMLDFGTRALDDYT